MSSRNYRHLKRGNVSTEDITEYQRVNKAYQEKLGTENFMSSPFTLDADETKVTVRRSAYPTLKTQDYFNGKNYNQKKRNMTLSGIVSAKLRERSIPDLQPGQIIDPEMERMPQYTYMAQDDTNIFLYLGAFVIGIVIFTSLA